MSLRHRFLRHGIVGSMLFGAPGLLFSQTIQSSSFVLPLTNPAVPNAAEWSKQVIDLANTTWTESNTTVREQLLARWAEQTPEHLAYVSRILQKSEAGQSAQVYTSLKSLFSLIKRANWHAADHLYLQRIVSSWSVAVPQLVSKISATETTSAQRRQLEQALVDLAWLSRDQQIGSTLARNAWKPHVESLAKLTRHSTASVRLVALSVLEAIGAEASAASPAVQKVLQDSDQFVRWAAIRTLQAIGLDQAGIKAVERLKNDEDSNVRQMVSLILNSSQSVPAGTAVARPSKDQPAEKMPAPTNVVEKSQMVPINATAKPIEPPAPLLNLKQNDLPVNLTPPETTTKPAELPGTLPTVPLQPPVVKPQSSSDPVPLFGPAPSNRVAQKIPPVQSPIQPVSASTAPRQEQRINPVNMWIPRLKVGTPAQQIQAVRELGKLGENAADAVPVLAELLLKSDVTVRREVPLALTRIGKPARMAVSVLERSLQDADTDVKVNAARALLELAD